MRTPAVLAHLVIAAAGCTGACRPTEPAYQGPYQAYEPPPPSTASASAAPQKPAEKSMALRETVVRYFKNYRAGTDFAFFKDFYAPSVRRFLTLRDTDPETMRESAKLSFRQREIAGYHVDAARLAISSNGQESIVEVPVAMQWQSPAPKAWPAGVLKYSATAMVALTFDAAGKIVAYEERKLVVPSYRVIGESKEVGTTDLLAYSEPGDWCGTKPKQRAKFAKGTVLQGTGEAFLATGCGPGTNWIRLRFKDKDYWAVAEQYVLVDNPNGGSSTGAIEYLAKTSRP